MVPFSFFQGLINSRVMKIQLLLSSPPAGAKRTVLPASHLVEQSCRFAPTLPHPPIRSMAPIIGRHAGRPGSPGKSNLKIRPDPSKSDQIQPNPTKSNLFFYFMFGGARLRRALTIGFPGFFILPSSFFIPPIGSSVTLVTLAFLTCRFSRRRAVLHGSRETG